MRWGALSIVTVPSACSTVTGKVPAADEADGEEPPVDDVAPSPHAARTAATAGTPRSRERRDGRAGTDDS